MTRALILVACITLAGCDAVINLAVSSVGSTAWNALAR